MDTSTNMPSALRHLLARTAQQQQQQQQQHPEYSHNTYNHQSAASSAATLQYQSANNHPGGYHPKLGSAKSVGNLKAGGSLGAWLTRHHLRPGYKPPSNSITDYSTISGPTNGRPISPPLPPAPSLSSTVPTTGPAHSAFITSVDTRESSTSGGTGEPLRMGGLRMGRKRFLVYRILVTGQTGQWWVAHRYSEFHDLYQTLRRMFPQAANKWGEFPSKRLLPGLGSSNDSVMQRRERLNAFLRSLMQTPQISQCSVMQQFLRDDPLDNDSVPLADREVAVREAMKQSSSSNNRSSSNSNSSGSHNSNSKYGDFELVIHPPQTNKQKSSFQQQQQQNMRSVSSGSALPGASDHSTLFAPWGTSGTDNMAGNKQSIQKQQDPEKPSLAQLPPPVNVTSPRTRESVERMKSMPSLKSAGAAPGIPNFDFSIPLPQNPANIGGFSSLSASSSREARGMTQQSSGGQNTPLFSPTMTGPLPMPRKISDPQEYTNAEKRPSSVNPSSMRKKYGLRRNMQYRNDASATKKSGSVGNGSHSQIPLPPPALHPDTAATLLEESQQMLRASGQAHNTDGEMMNWDNDYIIVDDSDEKMSLGVNGSSMDIDRTLRAGSIDSEMSSDVPSPSSKRGRNVVVLRRAPFGGVEKQRRVLAEDDPAMVAAKKQLRNAKRFLAAQFKDTESADEDNADTDGKRRNNTAAGAQHKVSLDDFHLLSLIGKGSYGQVLLARYKDTGNIMAIKVISKSKLRGRPNEIRRVMSERKVLERTVKHPFLVGLQCAFQTKEKLFFCLDYVNGGELFFHLQRERRFGENRARFYAAEITSALAYLHGMDVVYRDLKPENCLLDADGHVKIVDFGLAKEVGPVVWRTEGSALYSVEEGGKTGTFCGTPEYLAPEVLLRQRYGKEVDWYCLGAVLYEMLTGLPPFYDQDSSTMYHRILNEEFRFPTALPSPAPSNGTLHPGSGNVANNVIGRYAQDFVFQLMQRDPKSRLGNGVFGTENVKRHLFFYGIDWGKIYRQEYAPPFVPKVSSIFDLSNIDPEFCSEPIPESILAEEQINITTEAAEAERQADLELQAQLMAFPSPVTSPTARRLMTNGMDSELENSGNEVVAKTLLKDKGLIAAMLGKRSGNNSDVDSTIDAFRGFSFISPYVDSQDSE